MALDVISFPLFFARFYRHEPRWLAVYAWRLRIFWNFFSADYFRGKPRAGCLETYPRSVRVGRWVVAWRGPLMPSRRTPVPPPTPDYPGIPRIEVNVKAPSVKPPASDTSAEAAMTTLYLVGRTFDDPAKEWEVLGIYTTKARARRRCTQPRDFVGPVLLDSDLPEDTVTWPDATYPRRIPEARRCPSTSSPTPHGSSIASPG